LVPVGSARKKRLPGRFALVTELNLITEEEGFVEMPIRIEHAARAGTLPLHHRDLFDRLLGAQAQRKRFDSQ
jgi:PIN domain nuclease of toxin-antitoxin system